jgi:hypothetical protein
MRRNPKIVLGTLVLALATTIASAQAQAQQGTFLVNGGGTSRCLDQFAGGVQHDEPSVETCDGSTGQQWNLTTGNANGFIFQNVRSGQALIAETTSTGTGFAPRDPSDEAQQWFLFDSASADPDVYRLQNAKVFGCLELRGNRLFALTCNENTSQRWDMSQSF